MPVRDCRPYYIYVLRLNFPCSYILVTICKERVDLESFMCSGLVYIVTSLECRIMCVKVEVLPSSVQHLICLWWYQHYHYLDADVKRKKMEETEAKK
jgi:hypothetical protein